MGLPAQGEPDPGTNSEGIIGAGCTQSNAPSIGGSPAEKRPSGPEETGGRSLRMSRHNSRLKDGGVMADAD